MADDDREEEEEEEEVAVRRRKKPRRSVVISDDEDEIEDVGTPVSPRRCLQGTALSIRGYIRYWCSHSQGICDVIKDYVMSHVIYVDLYIYTCCTYSVIVQEPDLCLVHHVAPHVHSIMAHLWGMTRKPWSLQGCG